MPRRCVAPCLLLLLGLVFAGFARTAHADDVFTFTPALTIDALQNTGGGLKTGGIALSNLDLMADWKNDKGWEAWGYVIVDGHGGFSSRYTGDLQTVSNIDTQPAARLFEAWTRYTSIGGRWDTTIGLINLNGIFDVQPVGTPFLNASAGIGPDYSQTAPSIFPIAGLGAVGEWRMTFDTTLRGGLFDGTPGDPNHQTAFVAVRFGHNSGLDHVVELEHRFDLGLFKLGQWGYTVATPRWEGDRTGLRQGYYGQLVWHFLDETADASQGLQGWVRAGRASDDTLRIDRYVGAGLNYTGYFEGRDADQIGIAVMQAHLGQLYRPVIRAMRTSETTVEVTYKAFVSDHLILQPDVQAIRNPGADGRLKDALAVGLRMKFQ